MPTIHSTPSKNNKRPLLLETTNTNCNTPRGFAYHLALCCCSRKLLVSVLGIFFCVQAHSLFRFHRNLQSAPWPEAVPVNLLKKTTATKNNVDYSTGRTTPRSIQRRNQIIQQMQQAAVVAKTTNVNRKKSVRGIMESKIENHKLKEKANNNGHMQKNNASIAAELKEIQHPQIQNTKQVDKKLEGKNETKVKSVRGVIVLGMHRSGTSLLSGLLVHGLHYKSPGKLLAAHMDNPYGYYENYHVMKQNNYWLEEQHKSWDMLNMTTSPTNSSIVVGEFSVQRSCSKKPCVVTDMSKSFRNRTYFTNRNAALSHYNNKSNVPWIMKEPRLCFTMNMWRPLLKGGPPAVLLTFRHPLEVARSLRTRNVTRVENLSDGLKLWIWYNRMAIENSKDLCRVITRCEMLLCVSGVFEIPIVSSNYNYLFSPPCFFHLSLFELQQ